MIGIVIVNYKSSEKTVDYIRNEIGKISIPYRLVIVNVACNDESNAFLEKKLSAFLVSESDVCGRDADRNIFIVPHVDNLGYARGNNLGVSFLSEHFDLDCFLISNNDLLFLDEDVVEHLVNKLAEHPEVGAIGPKVVGLDGCDQSPCRRLSYWKDATLPNLLGPFASFKTGQILHNCAEGECFRLMGSFLLIKADAYNAAGGFDPDTFLYWEESILSERLHEEGYRCYYYPEVTVVHEHGAVISLSFQRKDMLRFVRDSGEVYFGKYREVGTLGLWFFRFCWNVHIQIWLPCFAVMRHVKGWFRAVVFGKL